MNETLKEAELQQLVDGELNHAERRDLLMRLDGEPEQWRRLALAFVESQIWDESIPQVSSAATLASMERTPAALTNATAKTGRGPKSLVAALALLVVLALGCGYWMGNLLPVKADREPAVSERALTPRPGTRRHSPESETTKGQSPPAGKTADLGFEEAIARSATPVPPSFRQRLLQSGYLLDEAHTLTAVTLPTGEQVEIPVRKVSVQYLGNAAYQ